MSETATELTGWDVKMRNITEAAERGDAVVCEWTTNPSRGFQETEVTREAEVSGYDPHHVYLEHGSGEMRLRKSGTRVVLERKQGNGTWMGLTSDLDSVTLG